jgi:hypothetical protein
MNVLWEAPKDEVLTLWLDSLFALATATGWEISVTRISKMAIAKTHTPTTNIPLDQ